MEAIRKQVSKLREQVSRQQQEHTLRIFGWSVHTASTAARCGNPNFVVKIVSAFLEDSQRVLNDLTIALNEQILDSNMAEAYVYQLKDCISRELTKLGITDVQGIEKPATPVVIGKPKRAV